MSGSLVTGFLKSFFEDYVSGLENVKESNFSEPITLNNLTLKVAKINEEIDDVGTCPFNLTDGKIGTLSLQPGWLGGLTISASAVELNLSFSAMKAMAGAVAGNTGEDPEEDYQNQVPWDVQQGMMNGHHPQPQIIPKGTAVFCKDHNESDKRPKTEPQTRPCQHCKQELTTNYQEFALCPYCSGSTMKCMICGKAASSSDGGPPKTDGVGAPPPPGQRPPGGLPNGAPPMNRAPPGPVRHHGTTCDNCGDRDFHGVRYRCLYCPDYDLCENCYTRRTTFHPPNHTFEAMSQPKGASFAPPYSPGTQQMGQRNPQQPPWQQSSSPNRGPPWQQSPPQQNGPQSPYQGSPAPPGARAPVSTPNMQYSGQNHGGPGSTGPGPQGRPGFPPGKPQNSRTRQQNKPGSWNWLFQSCAAADEQRDRGEIRR